MANGLVPIQIPKQTWGEFFFGAPERAYQFQTGTPQQQQLRQSAITQALAMLPQLQQQGSFEPIRQRALTEFEQRGLPSLADRFTALGGRSGSSAFRRQATGARAALEQGLAAQEQQFGLQQRGLNQQLLAQLLGVGTQPAMDILKTGQTSGAIPSLFGPVLHGLASGAGIGGAALTIPMLLSQFGGQQQAPTLGMQAQPQMGYGGGFGGGSGFGGAGSQQMLMNALAMLA